MGRVQGYGDDVPGNAAGGGNRGKRTDLFGRMPLKMKLSALGGSQVDHPIQLCIDKNRSCSQKSRNDIR